jgi:hypothetical protein
MLSSAYESFSSYFSGAGSQGDTTPSETPVGMDEEEAAPQEGSKEGEQPAEYPNAMRNLGTVLDAQRSDEDFMLQEGEQPAEYPNAMRNLGTVLDAQQSDMDFGPDEGALPGSSGLERAVDWGNNTELPIVAQAVDYSIDVQYRAMEDSTSFDDLPMGMFQTATADAVQDALKGLADRVRNRE